MNDTAHELRHQLTIAVATIEALIDGKLEPTQRRFRTVSRALGEIEALLERFDASYETLPDSQIVEICTIIGNEIIAIDAATRTRAPRSGEVIRDLLLNAIRYAPPGGTIAVECRPGFDELALSISQRELGSEPYAGGRAVTIDRRPGEATTFTVRL